MKASLKVIESIGYQDSFKKENIWEHIQPLNENAELIAPEYKEYIPSASLRRFSPVLRMSLACATVCQQKINADFDAISVGTSLGCLKDTEKFLETFIHATGETLSPTAFIQSTHNTIAGAISIAMNNHSYNMTHTQNSLSFETALIDGLMCIAEGKKNVLVGAADERIDFLDLLQPEIVKNKLHFTSGATFMVLQPANDSTEKQIIDCFIDFDNQNTEENIENFLTKNKLSYRNIALILYAGNTPQKAIKNIEYQQYTGLYFSSSAFAVHLANDFKKEKEESILIVNHQVEGKLGLTLIK